MRLKDLADGFVSGPRDASAVLAFVAAAPDSDPRPSLAEAIEQLSRAYYAAIDPMVPGRRTIGEEEERALRAAVEQLRVLHDAATGGGETLPWVVKPEAEAEAEDVGRSGGGGGRGGRAGGWKAHERSGSKGTSPGPAERSEGVRGIASPPPRQLKRPLPQPRAGSVVVIGENDDEELASRRELRYPIMDGRAQAASAWDWQPADSISLGLGSRWREVLGLSEQFAMPQGCAKLYVAPHMAERTDPLGFPVRLATAYYASTVNDGLVAADLMAGGNVISACKRDLANAVAHDNKCIASAIDPRRGTAIGCGVSEVKRIGEQVCSTYDGRGRVYLAECDCLRGSSMPPGEDVYESCLEAVGRNPFRGTLGPDGQLRPLSEFERDLQPADCERLNPNGPGPWGLPSRPTRISDPVAQNVIARFVNRAYRGITRFKGRPVACFYPPCSDRFASYGYTDPAQIYADLGACPVQQCVAAINVNWTSGNVTVAGNALDVRCEGGPCIRDGLPVCRNRGRCLPVPEDSVDRDRAECDCRGTGFKGPTCEDPLGEGEDDAPPPPSLDSSRTDTLSQSFTTTRVRGEAGAGIPWKSSYAEAAVVFAWVVGAMIAGFLLRAVLVGLWRKVSGRGGLRAGSAGIRPARGQSAAAIS